MLIAACLSGCIFGVALVAAWIWLTFGGTFRVLIACRSIQGHSTLPIRPEGELISRPICWIILHLPPGVANVWLLVHLLYICMTSTGPVPGFISRLP